MLNHIQVSKKGRTEYLLLQFFAYYAVFPAFLQFLFGSGVVNHTIVDACTKATAAILSIVWILIKFSPNRKRSLLNTVITRRSLLFLIFTAIVCYSAYRGTINDYPYIFGDIVGSSSLLWLCIVSYHSIEQVDNLRDLFTRIVKILQILAFIRIIVVFGSFLHVFPPAQTRWTYVLLLFWGYSYSLSKYLLRNNNTDLNAAIGFAIAILIGMEKPLVWAFIIASVVVAFTGLHLERKSVVMGKMSQMLFLFAVLVFTFFGAGLVVETPWSRYYVSTFETKYLKLGVSLDGARGALDGGRLELWEKGFELFKEKPTWGHGLGKSIWYSPSAPHVAPHNIIVYLLISIGIIGVVSVLPLLFITIRCFQINLQDNENRYIYLALLGFTSAVFAFGLVGTIWATSGVMVLLGISLGAVWKMADIKKRAIKPTVYTVAC